MMDIIPFYCIPHSCIPHSILMSPDIAPSKRMDKWIDRRVPIMIQLTQSVQMVSNGDEQVTQQISNGQIAEVLFNIATILEMQQGNPYRIEAYRNAARGIMAQ